jgi:hypothetical protein
MRQFSYMILASALVVFTGNVNSDQVILDDLIVDGSTCIGQDCVNGESFGFDTIRLKENNLRIKFQDTSTGSFPSTDWQITANESSNGGLNKFSIEDVTAGRIPFTIEANAPTSSLYVDDGGRVGLGTNQPVVDLHVKNGNTPTLRLEQDGTSGFSPQTWDVASNETNFFVRDATNGSKLPFRIRPGAPSSAIDIAASGNVGLGTSGPEERLHVVDNTDAKVLVENGNATKTARDLFELKNNGNPEFRMTNTGNGNSWRFSAGLNFVIKNTDGDFVSTLSPTGDLAITGSLTTAGTTCGGGGCDLVFDPATKIESIEEHAAMMWANKFLPAVGPTPENAPFNLSKKTGGMLNELEKAHIYIEQLHLRISALEAKQSEYEHLAADHAELRKIVLMLTHKLGDGPVLTSLD